MAYITSSNFKKVVRDRFTGRQDRPTKDFHPLVAEIENILSQPELALLQVYKEMCENPGDFPDGFNKLKKLTHGHMS